MASLWAIVQREGESFRNYIKRFTLACTNVKDLSNSHAVQIFIAELTNEHIWHSLIHGNVSIMHELMTHAHKFVEANEMREHHSHRVYQVELQ